MRHCDYRLFLLFDDDRVIGRIAVFINPAANEHWGEKIGFFGHYECIDDEEAAIMLLESGAKWLREQGMETMRGQWNLVSQDIGFVYEGFDLPPVVLSSYNLPYYNDQVAAFGMKKAKDLVVYNCDISKGYKIPDRFLRLTDRIARRYGVTVRQIDMKNLVEDARIMLRLSNESLANNWGYYPVEEAEAEEIAADLKMIVHPEVVLIAEIDGKPIGYVITVPDVNHILKDMNGRLFPFGIFKLLRGVKRLNRYRIWAMGILPQYQRKGISVSMFRRLNDILAPKESYIEVNYVLEDNDLMNNAIIKLGFDLVKRYRIYETPLT